MSVYFDVWDERRRQHDQWAGAHQWGSGDCSSSDVPLLVKLAVLTEEVGEVNRAALEQDFTQLRTELIQTAAVAVAICEWIDQGGTL